MTIIESNNSCFYNIVVYLRLQKKCLRLQDFTKVIAILKFIKMLKNGQKTIKKRYFMQKTGLRLQDFTGYHIHIKNIKKSC